MNQEETALIPAFHAGDQKVNLQLFRRYSEALVYFARMMLRGNNVALNVEASADITALAFRQLWERKQEFESFEAIEVFLFESIRNDCMEVLRLLPLKTSAQKKILQPGEIQEAYVRYITGKAMELASLLDGVGRSHPLRKAILISSYRSVLSVPEIAARAHHILEAEWVHRTHPFGSMRHAFLPE